MPTPLSGTYINPGSIDSAVSSQGGSATGDWFIHSQILFIHVDRENLYDSQLSTTTFSPTVQSNRLRVTWSGWVIREFEASATHSGSVRQEQTFTVSGDIGLDGEIPTINAGFIRRLARKDARTGALLDDYGDCNISGAFFIDQGNGAYDGNIPGNLQNQIVQRVAYEAHQQCENFMVSLISA